jgi:hypothetical protein
MSVARLLGGRRRAPKIVLIAGEVPAATVDQLHTRGDCFVSLSRGEGWSLGAFDAACFGNASIVTGWGGHLDYLGANYPLLVDYTLVPTVSDPADAFAFPVNEEAWWAHADSDHASARMRHVYEHRDETAALGAELRGLVRDKYAPVVVTSRLITLMARARERAAA